MSIKAVKWLMVNSGLACLLSVSNLYAAESLYDIGFAAGKATCPICDVAKNDDLVRAECDVTKNDVSVKADGYDSGYNAGKADCPAARCDVTTNDALVRAECDVTKNDASVRAECDVTKNDASVRAECDVTKNDASVKAEGYDSGYYAGKSGCPAAPACNIESNDASVCHKCSLQFSDSSGVFTAPKLFFNGKEISDLSPVEFSLSSLIKDDKGFFALKADKFAGREMNDPNAISVLSIVTTGDKPLKNILDDATQNAIAAISSVAISSSCLSGRTCRLDVKMRIAPGVIFQTTKQVQWFGGVCQKDGIARIDGNQGNECTVFFNKDYQVLVISQVTSNTGSGDAATSGRSRSGNTTGNTDTGASNETDSNGSGG